MQKAELKEYIDVRTGYRKKRKEASFTDGYNENSKEMRCESKIAEGDFFRNVDVETGREKTFTENNLSFLCALRNRELTSERGITLLSLIITVVIMIILAGVTINVTLGDGGLVDQAKWAAEQTANSTQSEQEQLENVASQVNDIIAGIGIGGDTNSTGGEETNSVDTNSVEETNTIDTNTIEPEPDPIPDGTITIGDPQWKGDGTANVSVTSSEDGYIIQYQINGTKDGSWLTVQNGIVTGVKHGDTIYARLTDGEQYSETQEKEITDTVPPQVTVTAQGSPSTNTIVVTVQAEDGQSGTTDELTYTYYIKQSSEPESSYSTPDGASNITNNTYNFTGLTQGTTYDIKVEVNGDKANNVGTGTLANQTTATVPGADEGLETGAITASPVTWKNEKAKVTLTANTEDPTMQIEYQVNTIDEEGWTTSASPVIVENLLHGNTVYARLTDGTNYGDSASITILDTEKPVVSNISVDEVTSDSIKVTVTASDNESGLADTGTYKYYLNNEESPRETSESNTYTFTGLTENTDYTIKVEAVDKAGIGGENTTSARTKNKTIADIVGGDELENTTTIQDDLGNDVTIPEGFGVAEDSGTKVEEGIVIEDENGNQFVWIPTGTYNVSTTINSTGKLTNNLSRRTFSSTEATEVSGDDGIQNGSYYYYGEGNSSSVASGQIGAFKASAESTANGGKGGFYIGRYEVGTGNVVKAGVAPYTDITRDEAKSQIEAMYSENSNVESELISSYAWDTALNFICQTNVESGEGYNLAMTTSSQYGNIGTNTKQNTGAYVADDYSNIHDLLGNCYEWTTEYSSNDGPSVLRGGNYYNIDSYAAIRSYSYTGVYDRGLSARAQLYIK